MTSTSVSTYTATRTHTATHLTEVILGSIAGILADLGLDLGRLSQNWDTYETAIKAWIYEGSLATVILECAQPSGANKPIIEFPVNYTTAGTGDADFTASHARMARFRAKLDLVPSGTTYRLVCTYNKPASHQPGWSATTRANTQGLRSINFGTVGAAHHASAGMNYHH